MIKKNDLKKAEKKSENPLVSFMKTRAQDNKDKWGNKALKGKGGAMNGKKSTDQEFGDNMTDQQEDVEQVKQESIAKASQHNQLWMMVRLISQTFMRYIFMIALLAAFAFLFIKSIPLIMAFFHGLISKVIFGALK